MMTVYLPASSADPFEERFPIVDRIVGKPLLPMQRVMMTQADAKKKIPLILDAWLDYIRLEDQAAEAIPSGDRWFDREGVMLSDDFLTVERPIFQKWKNFWESRRRNGEDCVVGCTFPSIHVTEGRKNFSLPLFTIDITEILSGSYEPFGWDLSGCGFQPAAANLMRLALFGEDEILQLVTDEGLRPFLQSAFERREQTLESLAQGLTSIDLPGGYRVDPRPYVFIPSGGNFTRNLKADLREIRGSTAVRWAPHHPGYEYLFGRPAPVDESVIYLGAYPSEHPPTASQAAALKHAARHSVTAVQGPPGSGKTTLILNLIAQQVVERAMQVAGSGPDRNTLVLVTSTNNRAVTNVVEKLAAESVSTPLLLEGGNRQVIGNRMATQLDDCIAALEAVAPSAAEHASLAKRLQGVVANLREGEHQHQRLRRQREEDERTVVRLAADLEQARSDLFWVDRRIQELAAAMLPLAGYAGLPEEVYRRAVLRFDVRWLDMPSESDSLLDRTLRWLRGPSERKVLRDLFHDIRTDIEAASGAGHPIHIPTDRASFEHEHQRLRYVLAQLAEHTRLQQSHAEALGEHARMQATIARNEADRATAEERLKLGLPDFYGSFFRDRHAEHADLFRTARAFLFQEALRRKPEILDALATYRKAVVENEPDYRRRLTSGAEKYLSALSLVFPVLTCTLHSVRNVLPMVAPGLVDRAIVDEAGMISSHHLLPVMARSNRAIVVGDPLQIEPVVTLADTTRDAYRERAFLRRGMTEADYFRYAPCAIETATAYHRAAGATGEPMDLGGGVALREHYRCAEPIALLCDKIGGYGFRVCTRPREPRLGAHLIAYHVEGTVRGLVNEEEVEAVTALVGHMRAHGYAISGAQDREGEIGVISPFRPQADALDAALRSGWPDASRKDSIGTVHTFQGGERAAIILSTRICRRSDSADFINRRPNLLNVAVSRAKEAFVLVGNLFRLRAAGGYAAQVVEYIKEQGVVLDYHSLRHPEPAASPGSEMLFNCDHMRVMREAIGEAQHELVLVCPWIRGDAARWFIREVKGALDRGVRTRVVYGYKQGFDQDAEMVRAIHTLFSGYPHAELIMLRQQGTHEKLLLCDGRFAVVGSWNWLSHPYVRPCAAQLLNAAVQMRRETSVRVADPGVVSEIRANVSALLAAQGAPHLSN